MRVKVSILERNIVKNTDVSRVPCVHEFIELDDEMVVEITQVIHLSYAGEGKPVAYLKATVAG